jgi:hypothetical protein
MSKLPCSIDRALTKLRHAHYPVVDLPCDVYDPLWRELRKECKLSLSELAALKNHGPGLIPGVDRRSREEDRHTTGKRPRENSHDAKVNAKDTTRDSAEAPVVKSSKQLEYELKLRKQEVPRIHYELGLKFENGDIVPKDMKEAVKWYRVAADQRLVEAEYKLGICYEFGDGVKANESEAFEWYRKAANQGHA